MGSRGVVCTVTAVLWLVAAMWPAPALGDTCKTGQFKQNGLCYECPKHAYCEAVHDTPNPLTVPPGYYILDGVPLQVLRCPNFMACPGGNQAQNCAEGYQGFACAGCDSGFFRSASYCHYCWVKGETAGIVLYSLLGVCVWLGVPCFVQVMTVWLTVVGFKMIPKLNAIIKTAYPYFLKLLIHANFVFKLAQITGILLSVPVKRFNVVMEWFYHLCMLISLDMERWLQPTCLWGGHPAMTLIRQHMQFALFGAILIPMNISVLFMQLYVAIEEGDGTTMNKVSAFVTNASLVVCDILYIFICKVALTPYFCMSLGSNTWVMFESPDIRCYSDAYEWYATLPAATVTLCTYCMGLPVVMLLILILVRNKRDEPFIKACFGYLYFKYEDDMYYFEMFMFAYRFLSVFTFVVSFLGLKEMGLYILTLNVTAFLVFMRTTPYKVSRYDVIEFNNFLCALSLSIVIQILSVESLSTETEVVAVTALIGLYLYSLGFVVYSVMIDMGIDALVSKWQAGRPAKGAAKFLKRWREFDKDARKAIRVKGMDRRVAEMLNRTSDIVNIYAMEVIEGKKEEADEVNFEDMMSEIQETPRDPFADLSPRTPRPGEPFKEEPCFSPAEAKVRRKWFKKAGEDGTIAEDGQPVGPDHPAGKMLSSPPQSPRGDMDAPEVKKMGGKKEKKEKKRKGKKGSESPDPDPGTPNLTPRPGSAQHTPR